MSFLVNAVEDPKSTEERVLHEVIEFFVYGALFKKAEEIWDDYI